MAPLFPCAKAITTVGVYNGLWRPQYNAFATALSGIKCWCGHGPNVHKIVKPLRNKWHAKVFIGKTNGRPSIGIIGSSNITRPAFGQNQQWNSEVDVILWDSSVHSVSKIIDAVLGAEFSEQPADDRQRSPSNEIFVADYAPDDRRNRGESIADRLDRLWNELVLDA